MPDREIIAQLRETIRDQREEIRKMDERIRALENTRNQMIGMSAAAKWGVRTVVALGGVGSLDLLGKLIHWLNAPIVQRPH